MAALKQNFFANLSIRYNPKLKIPTNGCYLFCDIIKTKE